MLSLNTWWGCWTGKRGWLGRLVPSPRREAGLGKYKPWKNGPLNGHMVKHQKKNGDKLVHLGASNRGVPATKQSTGQLLKGDISQQKSKRAADTPVADLPRDRALLQVVGTAAVQAFGQWRPGRCGDGLVGRPQGPNGFTKASGHRQVSVCYPD